jgi:hypothetical protein
VRFVSAKLEITQIAIRGVKNRELGKGYCNLSTSSKLNDAEIQIILSKTTTKLTS